MDRFQVGGSSTGEVTVSRNALYKCTNPVYVVDLPFIGSLLAEVMPLYFLLYSIRAEWVVASVRDGVDFVVHLVMSLLHASFEGFAPLGCEV